MPAQKSEKVRLHAPRGTDEANFSGSTVPYRVDNNGDVEVDAEAVGPLLEKGGFTLADPVAMSVPHGFIAVRHASDPLAGCSHQGRTYEVQADGVLLVEASAIGALTSHGFVSIDEAAAAPATPDAPPVPAAPAAPAAPAPAAPAPEQPAAPTEEAATAGAKGK